MMLFNQMLMALVNLIRRRLLSSNNHLKIVTVDAEVKSAGFLFHAHQQEQSG